MKQVDGMWKKVFSFKGAFKRKEFIFFGLFFQAILMLIGAGIVVLSQKLNYNWAAFVGAIIFMLSLPVQLAAIVKRARDRGHNPWLILILVLIPPFTLFIMVYLTFAPSKDSSQEKTIISRTIFFILFLLALAVSLLIYVGLTK